MIIGIVGLGLIGGSLCKALKSRTKHTVYGMDINADTLKEALSCKAVDKAITAKELEEADIVFVCLYPRETVSFIIRNINNFKKGAVVSDVCGIKRYIRDGVEKALDSAGLRYVGGHPMAGKEKSGFSASDAAMLEGASYILTKTPDTDQGAFSSVKDIVSSLGCNVVVSSCEEHDKIIAYTSQLAHVVSSSYVKSPSIALEKGFTGGSFQDMTRVALLEENMWKDLFLLNKDNLLKEIDNIIINLSNFEKAIKNNDENFLINLLKEGKEIKKKHLK
jgi:prephenate dehydrogenase